MTAAEFPRRVLGKPASFGYGDLMNTRLRIAVFAGAALIAAGASSARAQGFGGGVGGGPGGGPAGSHGNPGGGAKDAKPKTAPPDALPGAAVDKDRIIPSDHGASDLPPTEALFDAVNRGDIADARDAISRGAEINGRNVLGLTPLDLSVDLGRNDITFLLLSLRDLDSPGRRTQPVRAASVVKDARPGKAGTDKGLTARAAAPAPAPRTAPLFAGNGGAPVPNAGFLGFDTTQR